MVDTPTNPEEQSTQVQKYYGKYPGLVCKNKQTEEGAGLGELTVEVPGILEETPDGKGSQPIQVLAKPCFFPGFFFVPDIGAHVWVEFAAGDINQPIWTGAWYPKDGLPKTVTGDQPDETQKVIRTTGGNVVQFGDKDKEEKIVITHKAGAVIQIDQDGSILIDNPKGSFLFLNAKDGEATLMEQHGNIITMTEKGIVVMNKDGSVLQLQGDTAAVVANTIKLPGASVELGPDASEPTIMGLTFAKMYMLHTHAHPFGPTGPPIPTGKPLAPAPVGEGLTTVVKVK